MPVIELRFGEGQLPEAEGKALIHLGEGAAPIVIVGLEGGMASGKPSVAIGLDIGDGAYVVAETSLELLLTAARGLSARFEDQIEAPIQAKRGSREGVAVIKKA